MGLEFEGNKGRSSDRVDIAELSLEDGEKILRRIFAKINNGISPIQWNGALEDKTLKNRNKRNFFFWFKQKKQYIF